MFMYKTKFIMMLLISVILLLESGYGAKPPVNNGPRIISFSGYNWTVKDSKGALWGPGPNVFDATSNSVWVDASGYLNLAIRNATVRRKVIWSSAEVTINNVLGFGNYTTVTGSNIDNMDQIPVLGIFTYDSTAPGTAYNQIDIQWAKWNDVQNPNNCQFVIQPWDAPNNVNIRSSHVNLNGLDSYNTFIWHSDHTEFEIGTIDPVTFVKTPMFSWNATDTTIKPQQNNELFRLNLWQFQGSPPNNNQQHVVKIKSFTFTPIP